MIPVTCMVQEGQISPQDKVWIKSRLSEFTTYTFSEPADIDWIIVPAGSGFSAAEPSDAIVASLYANRDLDQKEREALQEDFQNIFREKLAPTTLITVIRDQ